MHLRILMFVCSIACLSVLWVCPCKGAALSDAVRRDDPRLQTPVTLTAPHILIGEFLEDVSRQTGVSLSAVDATEAGDADITVDLHKVPLADVMDSLWSLMSYQNAEWEWRRVGVGTNGTYQLARSEDARALPATLRKQMQAEIDGEAKTLLAALKMTPEELQEAGKKDRLAASMIDDDRVRQCMSLFAGLDPATQSAILHGQGVLELPVASLSAQSQEAVDALWRWQDEQTKKAISQHPEWAKWAKTPPKPTKIDIAAVRTGSQIVPALGIDVGYGTGNIVGGAWMDKAWRAKLTALWMLPGDAADDPLLASVVPAPQKPSDPAPTDPFCSRVLQLADAAPLSVMARLPDERGGRSSASNALPYRQKIQTFLSNLESGGGFQSKWRHHILLMTDSTGLIDDSADNNISWALVKHLRDAETANGGFLSVQDLAYTADRLNTAQLHHLAAYFPVMDSVAHWHDFFALYNQSSLLRSALRSPGGSTRDDVLRTLLKPLGLDESLVGQDGVTTRLTETRDTTVSPPTNALTVDVLINGELQMGQGFSYTAHQFKPGGRVLPSSQ